MIPLNSPSRIRISTTSIASYSDDDIVVLVDEAEVEMNPFELGGEVEAMSVCIQGRGGGSPCRPDVGDRGEMQ